MKYNLNNGGTLDASHELTDLVLDLQKALYKAALSNLGTPTEQHCGDNSQMWDSHTKTVSSNCLQPMLSKTYGANAPDTQSARKNRQLSICASAIILIQISCCVWLFDVSTAYVSTETFCLIYIYICIYMSIPRRIHIFTLYLVRPSAMRCNSTLITWNPTFYTWACSNIRWVLLRSESTIFNRTVQNSSTKFCNSVWNS